jgi:ParB family transcriptional regulator, chromosome partitioning protein
MSKNKLALGRGLASLIPRPVSDPAPSAPQTADDGVTDQVIVHVALDKIEHNPFQPRADFDPVALDELKRSIQEKGIIQPITVRRAHGGYQLISGERRVRAARSAGLQKIPAYIIHVATDEEMLELALIENLQREHLNPIEIAISYRRLIEECSLTQEEVAQKISKDRSTVTNMLRLLKLPEAIQHAVRKGELSGGHARAIAGLEDTASQMAMYKRVTTKGLSVRQLEQFIRERTEKFGGAKRAKKGSGNVSAISSVEDRLRRLLSTRVHVRQQAGGKGEIVVEFYSADDLERLLELFENVKG